MLTKKRKTRKNKIKAKIRGTSARPRLTVFRSNKFMYAQIIDDSKSFTLANASGVDSSKVGAEIAKKAIKQKVNNVVFDRSGYKYHGKVKLLCEAAREGGLKI